MDAKEEPGQKKENLDTRGSQGYLSQPSGPVEQVFGDKVAGDKVLGDKIAGDKYVIEAEKAYDVHGLPNPYLGLQAFTYADRAAYAGREALIQHSVARITAPGEPQALTFITGASGSGKSSFAQAGLLPALEEHYRARGKSVRWAVFRPQSNPLAALADALLVLGLPEIDKAQLNELTPGQFAEFLGRHTPSGQVNLVIIDQFEEAFTQSAPELARRLISLLSEPPTFSEARTHLMATLRSDYLDWLFEIERLWDQATRFGIGLRAMDQPQLTSAILKPLQVAAGAEASLRGKRFEPALVNRLAQDASADAAYLPLLQVTLRDLWERGLLKLSEYGGLAEAISRRAERVYLFSDFEAAQLSQERSAGDQEQIMSIFLDLVRVSLDDDPRRDVRRWELRHEIESAAPGRPRLVEQLLKARLLSLQVEGQGKSEIERISIIHEALIARWDRLSKAIQASRDRLRRRARFELDLNEWQSRGGDLLSGGRLADALALKRENDPIVANEPARRFLALSQERFAAEQRKEVTSRRRESILRGAAAGALAFGLLYLLAFLFQIGDKLVLLLGVVFIAALGALSGVIYNLGLQYVQARQRSLLGLLMGGITGSIAFAFPMLIGSLLLTNNLNLYVFVQAIFWGFIAGSSAQWAIHSQRPARLRLPIACVLSGLGLLLGEMLGHALTIPERVMTPSSNLIGPGVAWALIVAGSLVQLVLLLVARLVILDKKPVRP